MVTLHWACRFIRLPGSDHRFAASSGCYSHLRASRSYTPYFCFGLLLVALFDFNTSLLAEMSSRLLSLHTWCVCQASISVLMIHIGSLRDDLLICNEAPISTIVSRPILASAKTMFYAVALRRMCTRLTGPTLNTAKRNAERSLSPYLPRNSGYVGILKSMLRP